MVLDLVRIGGDIAILDVSAACHMPDVLEMPYRPPLHGGFDPGEKPYAYRLAGPSCLAGDVIGEWSFERPLKAGDRLAFLDQAHYTMVKNTAFNGIQLPAIGTYEPETGELRVVRRFGYEELQGAAIVAFPAPWSALSLRLPPLQARQVLLVQAEVVADLVEQGVVDDIEGKNA